MPSPSSSPSSSSLSLCFLLWLWLLLSPRLPLVECRDIIFPPRAPFAVTDAGIGIGRVRNQYGHQVRFRGGEGRQDGEGEGDGEGEDPMSQDYEFRGLVTFANLPYVWCSAPGKVTGKDGKETAREVEAYDIAFLGAPFDTGTTGRPGARFGPRGIRQGSTRISPEAGWEIFNPGQNHFLDWAKVVDCGDAPLTFLDNTLALKQLEKSHKVIAGRIASNNSISKTPRIIMLGGDHTTTLAALRSTYQHFGPVSVIHFDSHIDTWDPLVLGGGISDYAGVNHGTFLHIAHEEGLVLNSSVHAGIRGPLINKRKDLKNDARCGFSIITARDIDRLTPWGVVAAIRERIGDNKVYISVDIDVLDPAFAPGTGTAEVGGWTTRELLTILDGLSGLKVVGADVVEVAPAYDNNGETTVLAAAEVAHSLMNLMVDTPVQT